MNELIRAVGVQSVAMLTQQSLAVVIATSNEPRLMSISRQPGILLFHTGRIGAYL